jgi:hypothetical protein
MTKWWFKFPQKSEGSKWILIQMFFFAEKKHEKTIKKNTSSPQISQHRAQRRGSATISLHSWQVRAASRGD